MKPCLHNSPASGIVSLQAGARKAYHSFSNYHYLFVLLRDYSEVPLTPEICARHRAW
jgi:hypothetical protein